jgi:Cysteine rich repeat
MKISLQMIAVVLFALLFSAHVYADAPPASNQQPADSPTFTQACENELKTYCQGVAPGNGRLLTCLQGYYQQLSPGCLAVFDKAINKLRGIPAPTDTGGMTPIPSVPGMPQAPMPAPAAH